MRAADRPPVAKIVLTDPTLFGNDAAEDEREDIFYSYALERPELGVFADPERRLAIARAYKGEGKSALLRLTSRRVAQANRKPIIIARTADELAPELAKDDFAAWFVPGRQVSLQSLRLRSALRSVSRGPTTRCRSWKKARKPGSVVGASCRQYWTASTCRKSRWGRRR